MIFKLLELFGTIILIMLGVFIIAILGKRCGKSLENEVILWQKEECLQRKSPIVMHL